MVHGPSVQQNNKLFMSLLITGQKNVLNVLCLKCAENRYMVMFPGFGEQEGLE